MINRGCGCFSYLSRTLSKKQDRIRKNKENVSSWIIARSESEYVQYHHYFLTVNYCPDFEVF